MNTMLLVTAVALLFSSAPQSQTGTASQPPQGHSQVEQELVALDKKFDEARRKGDTSFSADFLTDDFVQVTPTGAVRTKAELLKALTAAGKMRPRRPTPCVSTATRPS